MTHYLPTKVPGYLRRLHLQYSSEDKHLQRDLIAASRSFVIEETGYDNWNGGTYGHDVQLFMPLEELSKVNIDDQETTTEGICADLNKLSRNVENEFFRAVLFEVDDESDQHFQRARPFSSRPVHDPDSLSIWKPGMVRLFIATVTSIKPRRTS